MKKQTIQADNNPCMLELRRELQETAQELQYAYARFDFVTEPALIEAGIYDINALKSRYDFLLKKMKALQGCPRQRSVVEVQPVCVPAGNLEGGPPCPS